MIGWLVHRLADHLYLVSFFIVFVVIDVAKFFTSVLLTTLWKITLLK